MKYRITLLTLFIITLFGIIFIGYNEETIITQTEPKKVRPGYEITYSIGINKTDELGNPLSGVTFKLKDINNTININIPETETTGIYRLDDWEDPNLDKMLSMFPKNKKEKLESFKTREEVENSEFNTNCDDNSCTITEVLPFIVEETKVPSGYIKEKYYVFGFSNIEYYFNENEIRNILLDIEVTSAVHLNYQDMINVETFYEDVILEKYNDKLIFNCPMDSSYEERKIEFKNSSDSDVQFETTTSNACPMLLVNKKGTIDLSVENFVNEKSNITTTNNKTLKYQIQIENKGTASSTENTIVSEVPKGLEYVEDSASHDGEYNKKEHQVEWKIEEIEAEETLELTYEAIVPKDADPNIEYIGTTSINSREVPKDIKSEKTIVTLEKTPITNPKTNSFMNFILLVIPGILIFGIYLTTYKRRIN